MTPKPLNPPRPPLTFRVGITGHRWDRLAPGPADRTLTLEHVLGTTVRTVLEAVKSQIGHTAADGSNGYAEDSAPVLAVISGLAEGADRIVANQGIEAGYHLWAILPFDAARYREDFDGAWRAPSWSRPGSDADFDRLRRAAAAPMVMDGEPDRFDAYDSLGRAVLSHSDLLIVIWDGEHGRGLGGTANVLTAARREEIPIVRIDPANPAVAWLEDPRDPDHGAEKGLSRLERRIGDLVRPPEHSGLAGHSGWNGRTAYFRETVVAGHLGTSYRALTGFLLRLPGSVMSALAPTGLAWFGALRQLTVRRLPTSYPESTARDWQTRWAGLDAPIRDRLTDRLAPAHGWLDHLATYYADRYRSAFTMVFSLAWMAAVAAVVGLIAMVNEWQSAGLWSWIELAVILTILGVTLWGKRQRFHERWIDYRLLAEQVRHLTFLWPLGVTTASSRLPANPSADDPRVRWTGWYYRALVRQLGFGASAFSTEHLATCRRLLRDYEIQDQRGYHDRNASRLRHLSHVVHRRTEVLFGAAAVVAALHVLHLSEAFWVSASLTTLSVFLPARAAALHGWAGHADFHAAAIRSADIESRLEELERAIDGLPELATRTLGPVALAAARTMESELGSWRATSLSRPLQRV